MYFTYSHYQFPLQNSPEKAALIVESSGTTGPPKRVSLSHAAVSNSLATNSHSAFVKPLGTASFMTQRPDNIHKGLVLT